MAVKVVFADGTDQDWDATTAHLTGDFFLLSKWNAKRRKLEDVKTFYAADVARAEIIKNGTVERLVVGRGRRSAG